ncbi:MAG: DUF1207 domain-containing protein [bacterium]|nr:DUF1207 domain-containing protein [bacterium]
MIAPRLPALRILLFALVVSLPAAVAAEESESASTEPVDEYVLFPSDEFFDPLVADLRWPRFSASHQWRLGTDDFDRVAQVSFGESFAFFQSPEYDWGRWEFGLQAMVDAIFDMTAQSFDLGNEDYFVAFTFAYEGEYGTALARISHTSSHLGDEFLIENGLERESVSYEVIDVLVSRDVKEWLRLYGGIGFYTNASPDYDPFLSQWGFELTSPVSFASDLLTPIFATDLQIRQANDWVPEVAVLAGLRLAEEPEAVRNMEFFARYYHGRSPDGQFFTQDVDLVGVGLRLGF